MSENKSTAEHLTVVVFGQELQIASDQSDLDIQWVADYVDQKMRQVCDRSTSQQKV